MTSDTTTITDIDAESLHDCFTQDSADGGAVYKVPERVEQFLSFSWIAVLPTGEVALARWIPNPEEDITLAREREESVPEHTGLHMWKRVSIADAAAEFSDVAALERLGTIEMVDGESNTYPHLDLDNPRDETNRPDAFKTE